MPIQLKNGKWKANYRYPIEYCRKAGLKPDTKFQKTCKSQKEAIKLEDAKKSEVEKFLLLGKTPIQLEPDITFEAYYNTIWKDKYFCGKFSPNKKIPTSATCKNTLDIFRLHLLPMFGNYSLRYLNEPTNDKIILNAMDKKSREYANIKVIKSYLNSIFKSAKKDRYILENNITELLEEIGNPRKQELANNKSDEDKFLTADQLADWILVINQDLENGNLSLQDYTLFILTLYLGIRKSEAYALMWKNIDLENGQILIANTLDKTGKLKTTKGHKSTIMYLSDELITLLSNWKIAQKEELLKLNIKQVPEQFLFTYCKPSGEVNQPVHIDYLNYKINSLQRRHKHLTDLSPHKLRHTYATLARLGGANLNQISEALTHSDLSVTREYVNTPDIVDNTVYNSFKRILDTKIGLKSGLLTKKETPSAVTESAQNIDR